MRYRPDKTESDPFDLLTEFDGEWEEEARRPRRRPPVASNKRRPAPPFQPKRFPWPRPPIVVKFPPYPLPSPYWANDREPAGAPAPTPQPPEEGSEYVRWAQDALNRTMGLRLPVDGIMGPETRSAVRSFQQRYGLQADGVVGPQTERALIAAGAAAPPAGAAPSAAPSAPTTRPDWISWVASPYHSSRRGHPITSIIYHFTVGPSLDGTVRWFQNNPSSVSAHYIIGKDGSIVQMVPLERAAHHAGPSSLPGCRGGVNPCSIGIEIVNWGMLTRRGDNFFTYYGKPYKGPVPLYARNSYWEPFTDAQYEALIRLTDYLLSLYPGISHITGHEDIAPGRKNDPGGAFDWRRISSGLGGFAGHIGPLAVGSPGSQELFEAFGAMAHPRMHPRCASLTLTVPRTYRELEAAVRKWIGSCVTSRTQVGGRPVRRERVLVTNNPSLVKLWQTVLKNIPGQEVKIFAGYNWGPNRVESISFSTRTMDMPGIDITVPPPMPQFIRKALELLKRQKQAGVDLGPYVTHRVRCLLNGLLDPAFDDKYVSFAELWTYSKQITKKDPRWDRILHKAREQVDLARRHYPQDEKAVLGALRAMDADIWKGIQWLHQQYVNLGSAMSPGMVVIKDWIAARQKNPNNVYACYR